MKIDYRETTNDLLKRIDIHKQFGGRDIDQWMLELLQPKADDRILDVACGAGKQCLLYHEYTDGKARITGGDVNDELLAKARSENERLGNPISLIPLDFDKRFPFDDNQFDLESCCFAIYYATDIPATIREMHRVLKPGGRLFTSGPMPENKQLFYDIIREATGQVIPPMPGSSRYKSGILDAMKATFAKVDVHVFENPLTFPTVDPFIAYTRASLAEDRKLWGNLFNGAEEFEEVMAKITAVAQKRLDKKGKLVMTKVVGGFVGTK
ncbi:MAG: methyltransferase domain-containing protein [Anaerolineales bacterium]|nr:methyltransferase domain-containing protein [Anaerolineales bacterium]